MCTVWLETLVYMWLGCNIWLYSFLCFQNLYEVYVSFRNHLAKVIVFPKYLSKIWLYVFTKLQALEDICHLGWKHLQKILLIRYSMNHFKVREMFLITAHFFWFFWNWKYLNMFHFQRSKQTGVIIVGVW